MWHCLLGISIFSLDMACFVTNENYVLWSQVWSKHLKEECAPNKARLQQQLGKRCNILLCYTSQLKYVFRLKENVSRIMGQNSLPPQGNNNLNFRLARDQVVLLESAANLCSSKQNFNIRHARVNSLLFGLESNDFFVISKIIRALQFSEKYQVHLKLKIRNEGLFLRSWFHMGYEWLLDYLIKHDASIL